MLNNIVKTIASLFFSILLLTGDAPATAEAAKDNSKDAAKAQKILLEVTHKVADYDKWKSAFDADQPDRIKAGLKDLHIYRGADDPNMVTTTYDVSDLGKAKALFTSPEKA